MCVIERIVRVHGRFANLVVCLGYITKVIDVSCTCPLSCQLCVSLEATTVESHRSIGLPDVVGGHRGNDWDRSSLGKVPDRVLDVVVIGVYDD